MVVVWVLLVVFFPAVVQADWGPDVRLTFDPGTDYTTGHGWCLAADTNGRVQVTWTGIRDYYWLVFYKAGSDTIWSPDTVISDYDPVFGYMYPTVDVDRFGVFHVVWWQFYMGEAPLLWYRQKASGGWGPIECVEGGMDPTVRADTGGNLHVIYAKPDTIRGPLKCRYKKRDRLSGWQPSEQLTGDTISVRLPCLALDRLGRIHVVFLSNGNIFYRVKENGLWSETFQVTSGSTASFPQIVCDTSVNLHMIWADMRDGGPKELYYKMKEPGGWLGDRRLTFTPGSSDSASMVVDDSQHVHVVWVDSTDGLSRCQLFYLVKRDTQWCTPQQITNATQGRIGTPCLSSDNTGRLHVVWSDSRDGNLEIYYKRWESPSGVEVSPSSYQRSDGGLLRAFPNPFTSFASIPDHGVDRFSLYDISGRKVGVYRGDRIGSGLSAGVYFLKPEGQDAKPIRIVKLR